MKQNVIWNRIRRKLTSRQGMTMVELLVVVAIIGILSGVGFVSVARYQRGMAQLERDGIAKEIFVAAQNHLTAAQGQGYLSKTQYGKLGTFDEDETAEGVSDQIKNVYYYVVTKGAVFSENAADAFNLMLPYGAIDETIRTGGSYLIRYQPETATVLDVFYCSTSGSPAKFNCKLTDVADVYTSVMGLRNNKSGRRTYEDGDNSVLGYYGGAEAETLATLKLDAPKIEVFNEDILHVKITDAPKNATSYFGMYSLKLILTGETSHAQKAFSLDSTSDLTGWVSSENNGVYDVVLDDITVYTKNNNDYNRHFCELLAESGTFIPGENVTVQAVAYSTSALSNIAYSESKTTNSLFADISDSDADGVFDTANVSSIRHLENLGQHISKLGVINTPKLNGVFIKRAEQTRNMNWNDFQQNISSSNDVKVYYLTKFAQWEMTQPGTFCPVDVPTMYFFDNLHYQDWEIRFAYDGNQHSITDVNVNFAGNAGLFTQVLPFSSVSNLQLIDFSITSTLEGTGAGALAGLMGKGSSVTNVVAFNSPNNTTFRADLPIIKAESGEAGGLIGSMSDECSLTYCAASLYVKGKTSAGGLVGTSAGTITGCYSGGHTDQGEYYSHDTDGNRTTPIYNVIATDGLAGGLVGNAGKAIISSSYSTCSVSGKTAGGFIGGMQKSTNAGTGGGEGGNPEAYKAATVQNCYCTGLVSGTGGNAFIGSGTLASGSTGNQYYKIVNEMIDYTGTGAEKTISAIRYKGPGATGITAIDEDNDSFNGFVGDASSWTSAAPYDATLNNNYGGRFNLKTVGELGAPVQATDFVNTHYGDWPSPEQFFVNTPTSS